jgi:hypothetical protein
MGYIAMLARIKMQFCLFVVTVVQFCSPTRIKLIGPSPDDNGTVISMTSHANKFYIIRLNSRHVEVFDESTFKFLHRMDVLGFTVDCVSTLVACATHNCLYLSRWNKMAIYRIDLADGNEVIDWKVGNDAKAISVNKAANVLVVCRSRPDLLKEYTTRGTLVRQIQLQTVGLHTFSAIQLDDDRFVCCQGFENDDAHRVCIVTAAGQVVYSYGNEPGSAKGLLNAPVYMAVDRRGFIFVANYRDNRIVVLNPLLTWLRDLSVDGAVKERVFLVMCANDPCDRLFVGDNVDGGRIFMFDDLDTI